MSALRRGDVVRSETQPGALLFAVISNDERNATLPTVLLARIVPVVKRPGPTAIQLGADDPFTGYVLADYVSTVPVAELASSGRLTAGTVAALSAALRVSMP